MSKPPRRTKKPELSLEEYEDEPQNDENYEEVDTLDTGETADADYDEEEPLRKKQLLGEPEQSESLKNMEYFDSLYTQVIEDDDYGMYKGQLTDLKLLYDNLMILHMNPDHKNILVEYILSVINMIIKIVNITTKKKYTDMLNTNLDKLKKLILDIKTDISNNNYDDAAIKLKDANDIYKNCMLIRSITNVKISQFNESKAELMEKIQNLASNGYQQTSLKELKILNDILQSLNISETHVENLINKLMPHINLAF